MSKPECQPGAKMSLPARSCRPERKERGREPLGVEMDAEPVEQIDDVGGEARRETLMLEKAYSRMRSQPMIQAISSPMVA